MGHFQEAYDADSARPGRRSGESQATEARQSPHFYRCTSRDHAGDACRVRHGPDLRPSGEEGDSRPTRAEAYCRGRDPQVPPRTKGSPGTRPGTGGPNRPQADRTLTVLSSCRTRTSTDGGVSKAQGIREQMAGSWSRCERRQFNKGYVLREKGNLTRLQPGRRNGLPRDFTNASPRMPSWMCT